MAFPKRDKYTDDLQRLSDKCQVLGYPGRLQLLKCLMAEDMNVKDLVGQMPLTQAAVSEHLRKLRAAGMIVVKVDGLYNLYSFDIRQLEEVRDLIDAFIMELRGERGDAEESAASGEGTAE